MLAALGWIALSRERLESLAVLVLVTPVAALVSLWAFSRPAITDDLQPYADRVNDGAWFGVFLCVGAALVCAAAFLARRARGAGRPAAHLRGPARRGRRPRRSGGGRSAPRPQRREDPRRLPGRERKRGDAGPDPSGRDQLQQPVDVVAGGLDAVQGRSGRRQGCRDVRDRADATSAWARSSRPSRTTCRCSSSARPASSASCSCSAWPVRVSPLPPRRCGG